LESEASPAPGILRVVVHESGIKSQTTNVGVLRLDPLQIRADTEASRPILIFPLGIELFKRECDVFLDRLEAVLTTRPASGPRRRLGLPGTISGTRGQHGLLNSQPQGFGAVQAQLRIELLGEDLRLLDELVQGAPGTIAELALVFNLRMCMIREIVHDDLLGTALDVVPLASAQAEELQIQLPRELWARQLAPALGHDRYRLVAVQMPTPAGPLVMDWRPCSMPPAMLMMRLNGERASRSAAMFGTTLSSILVYRRKNTSLRPSPNA
jgi:hypothetical protein